MRACALLAIAACSSTPTPGGDDDPVTPDAAIDDPVIDPCATPLVIPTTGRPLDLMAATRLETFASRAPCVVPGSVRDALESARTLWYDKHSLTPGYQDSFGDNVVTPIGMRPNTIDSGLIDLAVPGGHAQIFVEKGTFHFPFGRPIGNVTNAVVIDFWQPPEQAGAVLPVVHWRRDPNEYTHRIEWMFPAGTLFGEVLFFDAGGTLHPFEIRTRTRTLTGWDVDVLRPFPRATDLADAIEARRVDRPEWAVSAELDALVTQLRATELTPFRVSATHFPGAFAARDAGIDDLPTLVDASLIHELLRTTAFRSARGIAWKTSGSRTAWAASSAIVPRGYNAAAIEISEDSCDTCHRDAGRPFETWYDNILAYGELWGNDETFTWHPFTESRFVDGDGDVVNFNYDNREIRPDFRAAGLVAPYNASTHPATVYKRIIREWTDFRY